MTHLGEKVVPAVRRWLQLHTRRRLPQLRYQSVTGRWRVAELRCRDGCPPSAPGTPTALAEHLRSLPHVAVAAGVDAALLRHVATTVLCEHRLGWSVPAPWDCVPRNVSTAQVFAYLWEVGLSPRMITCMAAEAECPDRVLPVEFFLAAIDQACAGEAAGDDPRAPNCDARLPYGDNAFACEGWHGPGRPHRCTLQWADGDPDQSRATSAPPGTCSSQLLGRVPCALTLTHPGLHRGILYWVDAEGARIHSPTQAGGKEP